MEEIRILGIAPFESIRAAMERVAREAFPEVRFEAYTGDLEEGVKIAQRLVNENESYDVVISRGGTAELLKQKLTMPVVEITFSVYDILRAIKMAENYNSLYAIVGFPSITGPAHTLCDLLRFNTDIVTVHSEAEVHSALERLKLGGYNMVICDNVTHSIARELGYSAFLITSGAESLHAAFEHAVDISKEYRRMRRKIVLLQNAVRQSRGHVLVFNEKKELCYATEDSVPEKVQTYFLQRIGDLSSGAVRQFLYTDELTYLRVTAQAMTFANEQFYVFCYTQTILSRKSINAGIYLYEHNEVQHLFQDSFLSISGAIRPLEKRLSALAATAQPVLILGEPGTGKQQIAKALYLNSPYNKNPFVVINCATLNEKGWEFLFNSPSSPLLENHITLYFQDIGKLAYRNLQELLYYSNQISLKTRVFLIFSCIVSPQNVPPPAIQSFSAEMGCVGLSVIPLRSRADEIPSLANLYLNSLNASLGKQIIGLAPNAMDQLIHYSWPDNFTEFKAVLSELAALASSSYILNDSVTEVLLKERTLHHAETALSAENPFSGKTLEQIISAAINQTLSDCGGNQTLAAKQLGISRSTLWRHLN